MMEEDGVMKTKHGVMKAGDDDVSQGGGISGHWLHQVFRRKASICKTSVRVPVGCGMGLRNRI